MKECCQEFASLIFVDPTAAMNHIFKKFYQYSNLFFYKNSWNMTIHQSPTVYRQNCRQRLSNRQRAATSRILGHQSFPRPESIASWRFGRVDAESHRPFSKGRNRRGPRDRSEGRS